jgi:hypothetical protein
MRSQSCGEFAILHEATSEVNALSLNKGLCIIQGDGFTS